MADIALAEKVFDFVKKTPFHIFLKTIIIKRMIVNSNKPVWMKETFNIYYVNHIETSKLLFPSNR